MTTFLKKYYLPTCLVGIVLLNIAVSFTSVRIDLTSDKRYTLSEPTQRFMGKLDAPIHLTIYLDGELNASFLGLKRATAELLDDLSRYSTQPINYRFVDPTQAENDEQRNQQYEALIEQGMNPTVIYEKSKDGQAQQKVIFPWAKITYKEKTSIFSLLKNIQGNSGEENLNISIENLEYELMDALRKMIDTEVDRIAFIEGHGELSEQNTYDISTALSQYFQVDRGVLDNNARILDGYKAIIIAAPQTPFSESDKFIIDQYIMRGGRVLWLIDGVKFDNKALSTTGISPAIPLELNLTDQLFRYGVRINPELIQDEQCMLIPVNISGDANNADFQPMPWYFAPLLNTSPYHATTRSISPVSTSFASTIDFVGSNNKVNAQVLLATSAATHIISTPSTIDVNSVKITPDYFKHKYIPVGVALEGAFESVWSHRMRPEGIIGQSEIRKESVPTRQIVIASGSAISNEIEQGKALPLGYDRYTQKQFGNRDFLLNAILYLSDDEGWIDLRKKDFTLRLLNQNKTRTQRTLYQWINVVLPLALLLVFGILFTYTRKRKYGHHS